jgi:exodeoxyribonuclease VII small subunit
MSNPMARRKTNPDDDASAPNFEEALAGLEAIVDAMENQQLPLEDLVSHYEKGSELLDRCESILQSARGRIELITLRNKNDNGGESLPGTGETFHDLPPSGVPDDTDDDDIRLF